MAISRRNLFGAIAGLFSVSILRPREASAKNIEPTPESVLPNGYRRISGYERYYEHHATFNPAESYAATATIDGSGDITPAMNALTERLHETIPPGYRSPDAVQWFVLPYTKKEAYGYISWRYVGLKEKARNMVG